MTTPINALQEMQHNYMSSAVLRAAVKLNIFSLLKEKALSAQEVSNLLAATPDYIESFLKVCVGLDLLEKEGECYKNTAVSNKFLLPESREYQGDFIIHMTNYWQTWGTLDKRLLEGTPEMPYQNGFVDTATYWTYYIKGRHNLAMLGQAELLVQHTNLNGKRKLLDVGGAAGSYSIALCQANLGLNAVILDLEGALGVADELLKEHKMEDRIDLMAADFHEVTLAQEYDVVLFSAILRIISKEKALRLLSKTYDALLPNGLLIVQEFSALEEKEQPSEPTLRNQMMDLFLKTCHHSDGNDRSKQDIIEWIKEAGFNDLKLVALPNKTTLMIAEKN